MNRNDYPVHKSTLSEQRPPERIRDPQTALGMMWQLTCDAWAMKGECVDEFRCPRHIVRVIRGRR